MFGSMKKNVPLAIFVNIIAKSWVQYVFALSQSLEYEFETTSTHDSSIVDKALLEFEGGESGGLEQIWSRHLSKNVQLRLGLKKDTYDVYLNGQRTTNYTRDNIVQKFRQFAEMQDRARQEEDEKKRKVIYQQAFYFCLSTVIWVFQNSKKLTKDQFINFLYLLPAALKESWVNEHPGYKEIINSLQDNPENYKKYIDLLNNPPKIGAEPYIDNSIYLVGAMTELAITVKTELQKIGFDFTESNSTIDFVFHNKNNAFDAIQKHYADIEEYFKKFRVR